MTRIRRARAEDADFLAEMINIASEGFAAVFWRAEAGSDGDAWAVGRQRQRTKLETEGTEIWVIDERNGPCASLTGYPIGPEPEQWDDDTPDMIRPMIELEAMAPNSWYINVLATKADCRGQGLGTELLMLAEHRALSAGSKQMSIIVSDANSGARRLYERVGYRETARKPMVKGDWDGAGENWVLLTRPL